MRILIDAHMVGQEETGNETYIVNLIRGLQSLTVADEFFLLTSNRRRLEEQVQLSDRFVAVDVSGSNVRRLGWQIARIAARRRIDLIHSTYFPPLFARCPVVVSIHDLAFKSHPEWFSPRDRFVLSVGVWLGVKTGARLITLSEYSLREIGRFYNVERDRVTAIPLAAAAEFKPGQPTGQRSAVLSKYGITRPYILAVGNLQPRKNLCRLVEAFAQLKKEGIGQLLVIAGKAKWQESVLLRTIAEHGLEKDVVLTGYVADDDLPGLYSGADLFVYPSLLEGFGLPVVEAMASGVPVVAARASSIPEVAEGAAILVDGEDVRQIADGMRRVLADGALAADLRRKGMERAAGMSWENTARRTYDIYQAVLASK